MAVSAFLASAQALAAGVGRAPDREHALESVRRASALTSELDALLQVIVDDARAAGVTWQGIGEILGVSRQAAFQRFGHPIDPRTGEPMNTTPLDGAEEIAIAVFADLAAARWSAVTDRFDATMAEALAAEDLAAVWAQLIGTVGVFERSTAPTARRTADVTVVEVPLEFEAGDMVGRVSVRDDHAIAGLFVLTPAAAASGS
ncbi:hypothetical protein GCM10009617_04110 [Leifsonia poae]|uniref:DUF3887 domain-containing protein n=1 Tax=Leifsonia poae TaxID=110933 RepID=A0A9W6H7F5_9MICO|nr:hypothetical protein GCM10017584_04110 [Leifsonia poae]